MVTCQSRKKENLSLEQLAAHISNGKQIKVTFIFVALLGCQWPFLNGACKAGDHWILPHQPCQGWDISGSHRNARTKPKKPLIQQQTPAIRWPCRSCCFIVYQTKKKNQQTKKMGFWGFWRKLNLKMWERGGKMRSSRADLERTELDLTTHKCTQNIQWECTESFFPLLLLRRVSLKNWGKKYTKLHSVSCNSFCWEAGGKLNQQSTLKGWISFNFKFATHIFEKQVL